MSKVEAEQVVWREGAPEAAPHAGAEAREGAAEAPEPGAEADPGRGAQVVVLERAAELESHAESWAGLAERAAEANPFYEPWALLPSLRAYGEEGALALVLVLGPAAPAGPRPLWGLFPLERRAASAELPLPHLRLWRHDYSYLPIPLVDRAHGGEVLRAFFDWVACQRRAPTVVSFEKLPVGGAFHQLLVDEIGRREASAYVRDRFTRALLAPAAGAESYVAAALSAKHRKELARRRRRLGERGALQLCELEADGEVERWVEEFLALEASGWKGRQGSAMASTPVDARFFREMACAGHRAGRFMATALRLDGQPLAMQTTLRAGGLGYAFKMAYDERHARCSPGVLLVLDLIERVAGGGPLRAIDSVADRDHPMVNELWTERRCIESLMVALGPAMSLALSLAPAARWISRLVMGRGRGPRGPVQGAPGTEAPGAEEQP
jgi:CelD/BcsL family acetyltransferase involved in cellulose biosynthesis